MTTETFIEDDEDGVAAAVWEYLAAREVGRPLSKDAWLAANPTLASQLAEFLDDPTGIEDKLRALGRGGLREPDLRTEERHLGDYELLEKVGGNMGVVYRARQRSLPREVAVKLLLRGESYRDRFRAEAEAMARLHHPNIVRILEVSRGDGVPFFSMEWQSGGSLDRPIPGFLADPTKAVDLVEPVARAVHFAHQRGVLHRDLKPANVLLDEFGRPLVADFGLAVQLDVPDMAGRAGAGTPAFMAPEQLTGDVTVATDVHGLGAILFALLAGRPPFQGETLPAVLDQVRSARPRLADFNSRVDADLEAICGKCLAKDPSERYATAAAVADDLIRWKQGRPTIARPLSPLGRIGRVLGHVRPAAAFRALGWGLIVFALIAFVTNAIAFVLLESGAAEPWVWLAIFASYLPFAVLLVQEWRTTPDRDLPARRHLWSIWAGHAAASVAVFLAFRVAAGDDSARGIQSGYIGCAGLNALAFVIMGSLFTGRQFFLGGAWVVAAVSMGFAPTWAPLIYAIVIALCNLLTGFQLRELPIDGPAERAQTPMRISR